MASGYLMEDRAARDFLAWLQANPSSARRKLEDYMLMVYPSPDDIPAALSALLQVDPYADTADVLLVTMQQRRPQDLPHTFSVKRQVARFAAHV